MEETKKEINAKKDEFSFLDEFHNLYISSLYNKDIPSDLRIIFPEKVPFKIRDDLTNEENEYIFGLKRYLNKIRLYTIHCVKEDDFFKDELVFDATMYCLITIEDIVSHIYEDKKIRDIYSNLSWDNLRHIYSLGLQNDNFDLNYYYNLVIYLVPYILYSMYKIEGVMK